MTDAGIWAPEGALTFETAAESRRSIDALRPSHVDLAGVTEADSTALALLVHLARSTRTEGPALVIRGMPQGLRALAELYGVDALFDILSSEA